MPLVYLATIVYVTAATEAIATVAAAIAPAPLKTSRRLTLAASLESSEIGLSPEEIDQKK